MNPSTLVELLSENLSIAKETVQTLERELAELQLSAAARNEPGTLRKKMVRDGYEEYYLRRGSGPNGVVYLSRKEDELVAELATKQYLEQLLKTAVKNRDISSHLLLKARKLDDLDKRSDSYLERFPCVTAASKATASGYQNWWLSNRTRCNAYRPEEKIYPTHDGAMVRSKSEQSIYNELLLYGIPFQYELELRIGGKTYYPDFTLLDVRNQTEVYLEHYGLMDDPNYRRHYYDKVDAYRSLGLKDNDDYFCTFEEPGHPFDIRKVLLFLKLRFPDYFQAD